MTQLAPLYQEIRSVWNEHTLDALKVFVSKKSLSPGFDPEWEKNGVLKEVCEDAAAFGRSLLPSGDFEVLSEPGRSSCLFFSVPATGRYRNTPDRTVFFYGHLDKQPPADGWSEGLGPWSPVVRNGSLYGRGCSDDGYSVYAAVTMIRALENAGIDHPGCTGLIETREETGSDDLEYFLKKVRPKFGDPRLICVLDSGAGNYRQLWLTNSLRGASAFSVRVKVLDSAMHSGTASGVVPSSFDVMRILLDRLQNPLTGEVKGEEFNVEIPQNRREDIHATAGVIGEEFLSHFHWAKKPDGSTMQPRPKTAEEAIAAQSWIPTLSLIGADGIPACADAGNALRRETVFRFSLRLPPTADASKVLPALRRILLTDPPFNADVSLENAFAIPGWNAPAESSWFRSACDDASRAMWGEPAMRIGEGGSIPILGIFAEHFPHGQFAVTGVLGPGANAHGADENLNLAYTEKFMTCIAHLMASVPEEA